MAQNQLRWAKYSNIDTVGVESTALPGGPRVSWRWAGAPHSPQVYYFAAATVTKYHRLGAFNADLYLSDLESLKSKIKVPT